MTREIDTLRRRLYLAESALEAIRTEQADAVVGENRIILLRLQETQEALRQSEEQFRLMANGCPFMIWVHDSEGNLTFCNQAWTDFFKKKPEDVDEAEWQDLIHPDDVDAYAGEYRAALRERREYKSRARVRRHDGQWRWIMSCGTPQFSDSGEFLGMVGSSPDITEFVRSEERNKQMNDQLKSTIAERDKFFSIIAHDLRSPFIGFLNFIRILNDRFKQISIGEIQRLTRDMRYSAESLYNLLENLLEWSMLQRDITSYAPVSICLEDLVRDNIRLMRACAAQKDITFECEVARDLRVLADKSMLKMVLRNLISNAVKFSRKNGKVTVAAVPKDGMVQVSVADEGIGMDQDVLEKLFVLDKMSSRRGTEGEKGTGLGLVLCNEYVTRHGGEIRVQTSPDKGTVFYFTLPSGSAAAE